MSRAWHGCSATTTTVCFGCPCCPVNLAASSCFNTHTHAHTHTPYYSQPHHPPPPFVLCGLLRRGLVELVLRPPLCAACQRPVGPDLGPGLLRASGALPAVPAAHGCAAAAVGALSAGAARRPGGCSCCGVCCRVCCGCVCCGVWPVSRRDGEAINPFPHPRTTTLLFRRLRADSPLNTLTHTPLPFPGSFPPLSLSRNAR